MILKITRLIENGFSVLTSSMSREFGRSYFVIDGISNVEYDDFIMGYSAEDAKKLHKQADYAVLYCDPYDWDYADSAFFCGKIHFIDKEGNRKLLIYDTDGYLCSEGGKTIASFPHRILQDKETNETLAKNKNHAKFLNSIHTLRTGNKNFEQMVKHYMVNNGLVAKDMIGVVGFKKEWCSEKVGYPVELKGHTPDVLESIKKQMKENGVPSTLAEDVQKELNKKAPICGCGCGKKGEGVFKSFDNITDDLF